MAIKFEVRSLHAVADPGMRFGIFFEGTEYQDKLNEVLSFSGSIWHGATLIAPALYLRTMKNSRGDYAWVRKDWEKLEVRVDALLLPQALCVIESARGDEDVSLDFRIHFTWRELPSERDQEVADKFTISSHHTLSHVVPRSDWIGLIGKLGWGEIRFIELPIDRLPDEAAFGGVPRHLMQAEKALRTHDYESVLTQCRKAIDAASKIDGLNNASFDISGWKRLIDCKYPNDPPRQAEIETYVRSLKTLLQDGPHVLGRTPGRPEALFALSNVSTLLALLLSTRATTSMDP